MTASQDNSSSAPSQVAASDATTSLVRSWVPLMVATFLPAAALALLAYGMSDLAGVSAVGLAAAVVFATGILSLLINDRLRGSSQPLVAVLLGMGLRMAVALAACMLVHYFDGPLAKAGFVYYMLVLYPVSLAAEAVIVVRQLSAANDHLVTETRNLLT